MEITKNKSNFLSGLGEEIQKQPRFYFYFFLFTEEWRKQRAGVRETECCSIRPI